MQPLLWESRAALTPGEEAAVLGTLRLQQIQGVLLLQEDTDGRTKKTLFLLWLNLRFLVCKMIFFSPKATKCS